MNIFLPNHDVGDLILFGQEKCLLWRLKEAHGNKDAINADRASRMTVSNMQKRSYGDGE